MSLLKSPSGGSFSTVAESSQSLMGAYMHHDPVVLEAFIRSGSAFNEKGDRTLSYRNNEHGKNSKVKTLDAVKSKFSCRYTDKTEGHSNADLRYGYFNDLVQYVALGFDKDQGIDNLTKEQDGIFVWSHRTMQMLKDTKMNDATMEGKKLALIAYLFEIYYDLLIAPSDNVSRSAGLEQFIGVFIDMNII